MDVTQIPPPVASWSSWWPTFLQVLNVLCLVAGAVWTAWLASRTKKIDIAQKEKEQTFDFERERIKNEFERQKDFQDDLIASTKSLQESYRLQCEANLKLQGELLGSARIIRQKDDEIIELKGTIQRMQIELDQVKRHVRELEDKDRQRDAA